VKLIPLAGLLVSEVYPGSAAPNATHVFIEIYNPTANAIDVSALPLHFHLRTTTDTDEALTYINRTIAGNGGFLLIASAQSTSTDPWFAHEDATFSAPTLSGVSQGGGVYLSLGSTTNLLVLDKAGWGNEASAGFEGAAMPNIPAGNSAQRLPAGGSGDYIDTDNNKSDFAAASTSITPHGTRDPAQPPPP
jgi:hypothetical protein